MACIATASLKAPAFVREAVVLPRSTQATQAMKTQFKASAIERGRGLAGILAGAWATALPAFSRTREDLDALLPLVVHHATAGLVWHRVRRTPPATSSAGRELQQHYRKQILEAAERENAILEILPRLRAAGVEPISIKGWSVARLYPEQALRPSFDLDLCVHPDQMSSAVTALSNAALPCAVDLHSGIPDLPDHKWKDLFFRSRMLDLDGTAVRVLAPEDELRLLAMHLARHGLARPLWLCDLGAALAGLPKGFDWELAMSGKRHRVSWVACMLGLAHRLLQAPIASAPPSIGRVPGWIERAALWSWGAGNGMRLVHYLANPMEGARRLRYQGLGRHVGCGPIKAALQIGIGPSRVCPLIAVELAAFVRRKGPHALHRLMNPRRPESLPFEMHRH
jgi:hypothetical protein